MAEEGEVWEEIRDALCQLAEQGEKQTALLEAITEQQGGQMALVAGMAKQGMAALFLSIITGLIAVSAILWSGVVAFGVVSKVSPLIWWGMVILLIVPPLLYYYRFMWSLRRELRR